MNKDLKKTMLNDEDLEKVSGGTNIIEIIEVGTPGITEVKICPCPNCNMSVEGKRIGELSVYEFVCPNCKNRFEIRE